MNNSIWKELGKGILRYFFTFIIYLILEANISYDYEDISILVFVILFYGNLIYTIYRMVIVKITKPKRRKRESIDEFINKYDTVSENDFCYENDIIYNIKDIKTSRSVGTINVIASNNSGESRIYNLNLTKQALQIREGIFLAKEVKYEELENFFWATSIEEVEKWKNKSAVLRGGAGTILAGGVGTILGGMSGIGQKVKYQTKYQYSGVITYKNGKITDIVVTDKEMQKVGAKYNVESFFSVLRKNIAIVNGKSLNRDVDSIF